MNQSVFYQGAQFQLSFHQMAPDELTVNTPDLLVVSQFTDNEVQRRLDEGRIARQRYKKGNVTLLPPQTPMWVQWALPCEFIMIAIQPEYQIFQAGMTRPLSEINIQYHHSLRDPFIAQLCLTLKSTLTQEASKQSDYLAALVLVLATHLGTHYSAQPGNPALKITSISEQKLEAAIQLIHNSLSDKITWEAIAASVKVSPYHFSRLFKNRTGLSPRQYIIQARVEKARRLLQHTSQSIQEIAELCGFASASHLGSAFYRYFKVTPGQARGQGEVVFNETARSI